jgi:hypothetical protein
MSELEKMEGELMFLIDRVPYSTGESKVEGYKKIESLREEIKAKKRQDKLDNLLNYYNSLSSFSRLVSCIV